MQQCLVEYVALSSKFAWKFQSFAHLVWKRFSSTPWYSSCFDFCSCSLILWYIPRQLSRNERPLLQKQAIARQPEDQSRASNLALFKSKIKKKLASSLTKKHSVILPSSRPYDFVSLLHGYRPNWTSLSPITITNQRAVASLNNNNNSNHSTKTKEWGAMQASYRRKNTFYGIKQCLTSMSAPTRQPVSTGEETVSPFRTIG